jgi:NAD(P)-dependent dehydrogenase (short-subunit alcohol dehydrogenase family)
VSESKGLCIVTGGSRGIGAATAIRAAHGGWDVAINYAADEAAANRVADSVRQAGRQALVVQGDMSREPDVVRLFETATDALGAPTAVVANAGTTGKICRLEDMSAEAMNGVIGLNVVGLMLTCREAVRRMSTKNGGAGGAIVNLGSIAARIGGANEFTHYAASKGAVHSFTVGLSREVAGQGIRVNAVAPGMIDTEIHASAGDAGRVERAGPTISIGRPGTADEVADAIVWLLGPESSYCVGTIVEIAGGR